MNSDTQVSKNVKFVAYLRTLGIPIAKVEKIHKGKAKYLFELSDEHWESYKLKFDNSPEYRFAQSLEAVKDLAY